jgi:hypothetical protein
MNTASVSTLLNGARRTGCVREDRGADGRVAAGTPGAATGVAGGVAAGAGRTGAQLGAGVGARRRRVRGGPAREPERTLSRFGGQTRGSGRVGLGGLDSVEIRLAGTAGPSGHLGQLDEPVQGFGGLAEFGSGAGESGGGGALLRRGGDGGTVMPEGQELLQAGTGLQGGVQERVGARARGSGSSAARPVTTLIARAARCSTGSGIPLNAAACGASPSAAAICSVATPRSIARASAAIACVSAAQHQLTSRGMSVTLRRIKMIMSVRGPPAGLARAPSALRAWPYSLSAARCR